MAKTIPSINTTIIILLVIILIVVFIVLGIMDVFSKSTTVSFTNGLIAAKKIPKPVACLYGSCIVGCLITFGCYSSSLNDSQYATGVCDSNLLGELASCNTGGLTTFALCCQTDINDSQYATGVCGSNFFR